MGATSKRAKKVRDSREFDLVKLATMLRPPKVSTSIYAWSIEAIRSARDAQMRGDFAPAVRLANAMRTDAAILTAQLNRLAPARGLPVRLVPPKGNARARRILDEAEAHFGEKGVGITRDTVTSINATLADHEIAVGYNAWTPRADGSRVDVELRYWPLDNVRWDESTRKLMTRVDGQLGEVEIVHGDGTWVVFSSFSHEPWKHGAILAGALVWAARAFGVRDLSKGSSTHANAKVVGTMPEGIAIDTPEGAAFMELLGAIASADVPYGIKPFGAAVDYIVNSSSAWQVYNEVIKLGDRDAAKIYLGQDGSVNDAGGNYIKSKFLFGVRNDIVEGELRGALEPGFLTGTIEPWAAVNFGDSALAPAREWLMPDADEDARRESLASRTKAFNETISAMRENRFVIDQALVDQLALDFGVPAPRLVDPTASTPSLPEAVPPPVPGQRPPQPEALGARRPLRSLP